MIPICYIFKFCIQVPTVGMLFRQIRPFSFFIILLSKDKTCKRQLEKDPLLIVMETPEREREREFTHTRIARWKRKCSTQQIPASEIGFLHYQSFQFNAYISNPTDKKKTKTKKWIYREREKERDLRAWVWNTGKQHKGLHVWCSKGGDGSAQWDLEVALMLSSDFCINLSFLWFLLPNFPLLPFSASQLWFCEKTEAHILQRRKKIISFLY